MDSFIIHGASFILLFIGLVEVHGLVGESISSSKDSFSATGLCNPILFGRCRTIPTAVWPSGT